VAASSSVGSSVISWVRVSHATSSVTADPADRWRRWLAARSRTEVGHLYQAPVGDTVGAVLGRAIYGSRSGPFAGPRRAGRSSLQLLCRLRLGPAAAALPSEEFEGFVDELGVVLEDAAVAGVGVGDQLAVGQAAGQVG
jgi:hypothetical protein